jgi:hypothetical protein
MSSREMPMSLSISSLDWFSSSVAFNSALRSARRCSQSARAPIWTTGGFISIGVLRSPLLQLRPQATSRCVDASVTKRTPFAAALPLQRLSREGPLRGIVGGYLFSDALFHTADRRFDPIEKGGHTVERRPCGVARMSQPRAFIDAGEGQFALHRRIVSRFGWVAGVAPY